MLFAKSKLLTMSCREWSKSASKELASMKVSSLLSTLTFLSPSVLMTALLLEGLALTLELVDEATEDIFKHA